MKSRLSASQSSQNEELIAKIERSEQKLEKVSKTCTNLFARINEKNEMIRRLTEERDIAVREKVAIEQATFWRMTKPLRKISDSLKNKKHQSGNISSTYDERDIEIIDTFAKLTAYVEIEGCIYSKSVLLEYDKSDKPKILLVSHQLDYSGAPIALLHFAILLREQGYDPVLISRDTRQILADECEKTKIPTLVCPYVYDTYEIKGYIGLFDAVIANTIVSAPIIHMLADTNVPILWWIHEARDSFNFTGYSKHLEFMPQQLPRNVHVYTAGPWAGRILHENKPLYKSRELLYYVPEVKTIGSRNTHTNKLTFAYVGTLDYRKGSDILVDAIDRLGTDNIEKCHFILVGMFGEEEIHKKIQKLEDKYPSSITCIECLSREDIHKLYEEIDCLICSSRDDPMPIVVTEAMQHSKVVICSENTGSASIIKEMQAGLTYANNDIYSLAECINTIINSSEDIREVYGKNGREAYQKYFSYDVFCKNAIDALENAINNKRPINDFLAKIYSMTDEYVHIHPANRLASQMISSRPKALLVSHEFSLTGAPIALLDFGKVLERQGFDVMFASHCEGPLAKELKKADITYFTDEHIYSDGVLRDYANCFSLIVINTMCTYMLAKDFANIKTPVIWWVHDAKLGYSDPNLHMPSVVSDNIHIYCAGDYAKKALLGKCPAYKTSTLLYSVADRKETYSKLPAEALDIDFDGKHVFTIISRAEVRKGWDVFIDAIEYMPHDVLEQCEFVFIGEMADESIKTRLSRIKDRYPEHIFVIGTVEHESIFSIIEKSTCIVCSSKDDPMPVFVTEAMMMGTPVILSENTGQAPIFEKEDCGLVYKNNDPRLLCDCMLKLLASPDERLEMTSRARKVYEKYFTENVFEKNISDIISKLQVDDKVILAINAPINVSVIIPTYNAGEQFTRMMMLLRSQKYVDTLEIVVVDSGSTDKTMDIAIEYGAKVIEISHEDFSHSYARNKGASHASGDVYLFMTQDALPIGEDFVYRMAEPILSGRVAAVSGRELCSEETQLHYKVAVGSHQKFLQIDKHDRYSRLKDTVSPLELRSMANMHDIACAISSPIFDRFQYRNDYAEDLDLGIRLLHSGYAILNSHHICVRHGHDRTGGYYLKRNLVEGLTFDNIIPELSTQIDGIHAVALRIISCAMAVSAMINKSLVDDERMRNIKTALDYITYLVEECDKYISEPSRYVLSDEVRFDDDILEKLIDICRAYCLGDMVGDYALLGHLRAHIWHVLRAYMQEHGMLMWEASTVISDINDSLVRQMASNMGYELSKLRYNDMFEIRFGEFLEGV